MLTKSTFGTRENDKLWFVSEFRLFGFLVYRKAIEDHVAQRAHQLI